MSIGGQIVFWSLLTSYVTFWPIALSNGVQRRADRLRITNPDKLCFRASKWTYAVVVAGVLMSLAFIVLGFAVNTGAGVIYTSAGIVFILLAILSFWELKRTRVVFEVDGFRYIAFMKDVKVMYRDITLAYGSNGFITVKLANKKGVSIQILFEEPAKLLATIWYYSWQAKNKPLGVPFPGGSTSRN